MDDPKINNYATNDISHTPPITPNPVNPSAPAPAPQSQKLPTDKPSPRKTLKTILISLAALLAVLFAAAFLLVAKSTFDSENAIAKLLGLSQVSFINGLIVYIHIIFFLGLLTLAIFTMISLIRAARTKIEDKETKKHHSKKALIFGIPLIILLIVWTIAYLYLDTKRLIDPDTLPKIVTEPAETLNLSAPVEIIFNASQFTFDQTKYQIVSHNWNFGDTETATSQIVAHRYIEKGTYNVTLEIMLRNKKTGALEIGGTYSLIVSVTNEALSAKFSADPQSGPAPLKVTLNASESKDPDGTIKTYEWDLDNDGKYDDETGPEIEHTFQKIGKYLVGLRVTSSTGEFDTAEKEINVKKEDLPTAEITVLNEPDNFLAGTSYTFQPLDASSPNGKILKFVWDFGDGTRPQNSKSASKAFKNPGTYQVTLTLTDEKDTVGTIKRVITVGTLGGAPKPVLQTTPTLKVGETALIGTAPFNVNFSGENSLDSDYNIVQYSWDLDGDKIPDQFGETIDYTFRNPGNYTVTLQVSDSDDNRASTTINVQVKAPGLTAQLLGTPNQGTVPLTVNFDASGSSYAGGQITSYRWDFGDNSGEKLGAAQISHKYTSIGTYTAKMTAIASDGTQNSTTMNITVRETPLAACFSTVFETGPAPLATTFDPTCSTGTISTYFWNFSDGGTSTKAKPAYTFDTPGTYTVTLEISDTASNISQFSKVIEVR